jgi:molybdopterin-containing oxidoreductase family membrane subunit
MENPDKNLNTIVSFSKQVDTRGFFGLIWMFALLAVIAFGMVALITQLVKGHVVTGMRDNVVWGIYISNFIFFMGISYAGGIFSGILKLFRVPWRTPIIRIVQMISVTCGLIGPLYILLCIGRLDRLHLLFTKGRIPSPITWDILAVITFMVGNMIFLFLSLVPDLAYLKDSKELRISKWRKKLYTFLSINYKGTYQQIKDMRLSQDILAAILIPISILLATILSWIFGMTLRPGWNSTIFGPYFVFASLYSGVAVIIIIMWVFRKRYNLQEFITKKHFNYLGTALVVLSLSYGYFTFNEYFTIWYSFEKWDAQLIDRLLDFKQYGWLFIFTNYVGILSPLIVIGIPWFRSINSIGIVSVLVVLGMWVKRYLIVIPTLETPLFPMQDTRPEFIHYSATWVEWGLTLSGVALFLLIITLITKVVPIIQITEPVSEKLKALKALKEKDDKKS